MEGVPDVHVDGCGERCFGRADQAASVNTGSGLKDGTLKGKDFFNVDEDPLITFTRPRLCRPARDLMCRARYHSRRLKPRPCMTVSGKGQGRANYRDHGFRPEDFGMTPAFLLHIADRVRCVLTSKQRVVGLCRLQAIGFPEEDATFGGSRTGPQRGRRAHLSYL